MRKTAKVNEQAVEHTTGNVIAAITSASVGMRVLINVVFVARTEKATHFLYDEDMARSTFKMIERVSKLMEIKTRVMRCPNCIGYDNGGIIQIESTEKEPSGYYDVTYTFTFEVSADQIRGRS